MLGSSDGLLLRAAYATTVAVAAAFPAPKVGGSAAQQGSEEPSVSQGQGLTAGRIFAISRRGGSGGVLLVHHKEIVAMLALEINPVACAGDAIPVEQP